MDLSVIYVLISCQAPASMKSICQAGWLLTVCVGNIIDAAVTQSQIIENQVQRNL